MTSTNEPLSMQLCMHFDVQKTRTLPDSIDGAEKPEIAIYSGFFDPPSNKHVAYVEQIFQRSCPAAVFFLPRSTLCTASLEKRCEMLRKTFSKDVRVFVVSRPSDEALVSLSERVNFVLFGKQGALESFPSSLKRSPQSADMLDYSSYCSGAEIRTRLWIGADLYEGSLEAFTEEMFPLSDSVADMIFREKLYNRNQTLPPFEYVKDCIAVHYPDASSLTFIEELSNSKRSVFRFTGPSSQELLAVAYLNAQAFEAQKKGLTTLNIKLPVSSSPIVVSTNKLSSIKEEPFFMDFYCFPQGESLKNVLQSSNTKTIQVALRLFGSALAIWHHASKQATELYSGAWLERCEKVKKRFFKDEAQHLFSFSTEKDACFSWQRCLLIGEVALDTIFIDCIKSRVTFFDAGQIGGSSILKIAIGHPAEDYVYFRNQLNELFFNQTMNFYFKEGYSTMEINHRVA